MSTTKRVVIAILIIVSLAGCGRQVRDTHGKILVAASITPLADFARNVGGKRVQVEVLVPPGASPHVYQINSKQMEFVGKANALVLNGVNLEFWADKVIDAANNPKLVVTRTADGLKIIGDEHHLSGNPHVWLDPINAIHQVKAIRDALIKADPAHKSEYTANADKYIEKLNRLDKDIEAEVSKFKTRDFIAFHPAWVYFARRYGLVEAAVIERNPGKEPTLPELSNIIKTARKLKAKAIFAEPQFSPKAANVIAEEAGAKVLFVDPLGKPPAYDYIQTMRDNLKQMAKALDE